MVQISGLILMASTKRKLFFIVRSFFVSVDFLDKADEHVCESDKLSAKSKDETGLLTLVGITFCANLVKTSYLFSN